MKNKKSVFSNFLVGFISSNHVILPKIHQCLPNVLEIISKILSMTCKVLGSGLSPHFQLRLTPPFFSLATYQSRWPSFYFSNTPGPFLPQGLCRQIDIPSSSWNGPNPLPANSCALLLCHASPCSPQKNLPDPSFSLS